MFNRGKQMEALDLPELREQAARTLGTVEIVALIVAACALGAFAIYAFTQAVKDGAP